MRTPLDSPSSRRLTFHYFTRNKAYSNHPSTMIFIHSTASATATTMEDDSNSKLALANGPKIFTIPSTRRRLLLQPDNTSRHGMEAGRRRLSIRYRYYYPSVHWQQYAPLLCSPQFLPSSSVVADGRSPPALSAGIGMLVTFSFDYGDDDV